jgi:hypothetical protein
MKHKNIVIAPCGNKSVLFSEQWLKFEQDRQFDLCLLFYHQEIHDSSLYKGADYFFHLKGFKYQMLHELFAKLQPDWLTEYDYFYFLDDDIEIDTYAINEMFTLGKVMAADISQASLTKDSFCSWPIFKQDEDYFCRFVGQIEVMAPLFSKQALAKCLPSFTVNNSSWGVDSIWSKQLNYPKDKLIVFDCITMRHTKPVGEGELYKRIGVDPHEDWQQAVDKFQAKKHCYKEYSGMKLVHDSPGILMQIRFALRNIRRTLVRVWNDYDLMSRVRNKQQQMEKLVAKK